MLFLRSKGEVYLSITLFIAEKPDVAQSIASALSPVHTKKRGYIEGQNGMIFTWAIGHLVEIQTPDKIDPKYKKWCIEDLPILPDKFTLQPIKGKEQQIQVIRNLVNQVSNKNNSLNNNNSIIVNSCDSGREGELIFYLLALYLNFTKSPIKRLWTSSVQPEGIRKAYKHLKTWESFSGLRSAALVRSQADWLIGINATRAYTISANMLLKIGRIIAPLTALVYDLHMERKAFKIQSFYPVVATFRQGNINYIGKYIGDIITDSSFAERISQSILHKSGVISDKKEGEKKVNAPLLMDLTDLSKEANKRYGYKAKKTLQLAQSLYEKHKCITYPRTSSRYVTEEEIPFMHEVFSYLSPNYSSLSKHAEPKWVSTENKRICNSPKVTDHHAILPEPVTPQDLSADESKIYEIIVTRFFYQFYGPAIYKMVQWTTTCENIEFESSYKERIVKGWEEIKVTEIEEEQDSDSEEGNPGVVESLPALCQEVTIEDKKTSPPPLFTDGTLMEAMNNVSRKMTDPKLKEALKGKGIGTVATRPSTIEKLETEEYIFYKGKSLDITKKGITLIEALRKTKIKTLTSPEYTALWEIQLEEIEKGNIDAKSFMKKVEQYTSVIVDEAKNLKAVASDFEEELGDCPSCGKPIRQSDKRYFCSASSEGCPFFIWKTQYFKNVTPSMLKTLLLKKKTGALSFKSKTSTYKAILILKLPITDGRLEREFK